MNTPDRSVEEIADDLAREICRGTNRLPENKTKESGVAFYARVKKTAIQHLQAERQKREEMVEYGRVSVLKDFDSLMKADGFVGFTDDEWKAVQKFFRYNDEISGWKLTQPNNK
jgi:hypothetical protein